MILVVPVSPFSFADDYLTQYADTYVDLVERSVRISPTEWRADSLAKLMQVMYEEGQYVRSASPAATVVYVRLLNLIIEYLKSRPNKWCKDIIRARVTADIEIMRKRVWPRLEEYTKGYAHFNPPQFDARELVLMKAAYNSCVLQLEQLA